MSINFLKEKNEIIKWLEEHYVKNYTLIEDKIYNFVVDVDDDVRLYIPEDEVQEKFDNIRLTEIPVKFRIIKGSFWCYNNNLTSLEFCPEVVKREFDCRFNKIDSLEFIPKKVGTYFNCYGNEELGQWQNERDYHKILAHSNKIREIKESKSYLENTLLPSEVINIKKNKI